MVFYKQRGSNNASHLQPGYSSLTSDIEKVISYTAVTLNTNWQTGINERLVMRMDQSLEFRVKLLQVV
jgi:hypothetical protein